MFQAFTRGLVAAGYPGSRLDAVAREARCSAGAISKRFGSESGLLGAYPVWRKSNIEEPFLTTRAAPQSPLDALAVDHVMPIELAPELVEAAFADPAASMALLDYQSVVDTMTARGAGDLQASAPGGESLDEVLARFLPVVTETITCSANQPGDLLFVSHSITLSAALPFLFENLAPSWTLTNVLPNAAIATGGYVDGRLVCTDWNGMEPG